MSGAAERARDATAMRAEPDVTEVPQAPAGIRRCGARTRAGRSCRKPAVTGKRRCRYHGGAPGIGARRGNKNALKHGYYTREAIADRRRLRRLMRALARSLEGVG